MYVQNLTDHGLHRTQIRNIHVKKRYWMLARIHSPQKKNNDMYALSPRLPTRHASVPQRTWPLNEVASRQMPKQKAGQARMVWRDTRTAPTKKQNYQTRTRACCSAGVTFRTSTSKAKTCSANIGQSIPQVQCPHTSAHRVAANPATRTHQIKTSVGPTLLWNKLQVQRCVCCMLCSG